MALPDAKSKPPSGSKSGPRVLDDGTVVGLPPQLEAVSSSGRALPKPRRPMQNRPFTETHQPPKLEPSTSHFDNDEWFTPAQDSKGHSTKVWFRLPPIIARELEVILASKCFPYQTTDDLIRHAVYRHIFLLHMERPNMKRHLLTAIALMCEQMRDEQYHDVVKAGLEWMKTACQKAIDDKATNDVARICMVTKGYIDGCKSDRWKKAFMDDWKRLSTAYLNEVKVIQMGNRAHTIMANLPKAVNEE